MFKHRTFARFWLPVFIVAMMVAATVSAQGTVDLRVDKIAPVSINYGETTDYIVRVTNLGDTAATGVTLMDTLPAGFTVTSTVPGTPTCNTGGGTVACGFGTLAAGESAVVRVSGTFDTSSETHDMTSTNGATFALDTMSVSYTLPGTQSILSVAPAGECSFAGQVVDCSFDNVEAGGTRTATVEVATGSDFTATNSAAAVANEADADLNNDSDSADTNVTTTALPNQAPVLMNFLDRSDNSGTVIAGLASLAVDADQDALTYGATDLPTGLTINPATGIISGTINVPTTTIFTPTISVSDGINADVTQGFTWEVINDDPTPSCGALVQEAEDAESIAGFTISDDPAASGGQYISSTAYGYGGPSVNQMANFCVTIEQAGTYKIVANVYAENGSSDSMWVEVDRDTEMDIYKWAIRQNTSYLEDDVNDLTSGQDPVEIDLTAGDHIISFSVREPNARLDRIELVPLDFVVENNAPTTSGIGNITAALGTVSSNVNLYPSFDDEEDADAAMTYIVTGNTNPALFSDVSILNGMLTLTYAAGVTGTADITVQATDTGGLSVDTTFTVTVTEETGVEGRVTDNLLVLYTFNEGSGTVVRDVGGVGVPLDLNIDTPGNVTWGAGTLTIDTSANITTPGAATKLYDALTTSNAFTVEAWVTPANNTQYGPTRLATYSGDKFNSNFTFGQGGGSTDPRDIFVGRIRTTTTNNVGQPSTDTPGGTATPTLTHVVLTRATDGTTSIYVNGVLVQSGTAGGNLSNWNDAYRFGLANEFGANRPWLGTYHLLAIYEEALTPTEIQQNFGSGPEEEGVGVNTPPYATGSLPNVTTTSNAPDTVIDLYSRFEDAQDADEDLTYIVTGNTNPALFTSVSVVNGSLVLDYAPDTDGVSTLTLTVTDTGGQSITANMNVTVIGTTPVETVKIMPLGDSLTHGRWDPDLKQVFDSYRWELSLRLDAGNYSYDFVGSKNKVYANDFDTDNEGHSGWRADQIANSVESWMFTYQPDVVLLHIGTNDLAQGQDTASTIADIQNIITRIRNQNPNAIILLAQIIPFVGGEAQVADLNNNIATLASLSTAQSPIIIVDHETGFDAATMTYDGVHATTAGEEHQAIAWFGALKPVLDSFGAGMDAMPTTVNLMDAPRLELEEAEVDPVTTQELNNSPEVQVVVPRDGSLGTQPEVTVMPEATEEPEVTVEPEITEEPAVTVEPEVTEAPNQPPTVQVPLAQTNVVGDVVSVYVGAADPEQGAMRFATNWDGVETLPAGLSIDPATGLISGTIAAGAEAGNPYTVTVTVIDATGLQATASFQWTVTATETTENTNGEVVVTEEATAEAPEATPEVVIPETTPEVVVPEVTPEATQEAIVPEVEPEVTPEVTPDATANAETR